MTSTPTTAVVVLTGGDLACLPDQVRQILTHQETLMADFAALRSALEQQKTEMTAAIDRVAADVTALQQRVAELQVDTADQEQINELAAQVQESVSVLRGIDPVRAADEAEGGDPDAEPAPEEPTGPDEEPAPPAP